MTIDPNTLSFYIGAATRGEGVGKWSAPGRDLPYLYERKHSFGVESSIEPDLDTWKRFGIARFQIEGSSWEVMNFNAFMAGRTDNEMLEILGRCKGTYLSESKDLTLDLLGCPA